MGLTTGQWPYVARLLAFDTPMIVARKIGGEH